MRRGIHDTACRTRVGCAVVMAGLAGVLLLVAPARAAAVDGQGAADLSMALTGESDGIGPAPGWAQEDPADALYRAAREALNRSQFSEAARTFREIHENYPRSAYTPDSYYWEGFALYRMGGTRNMRAALGALEYQQQNYRDAPTAGDGAALAVRIRGELARMGDREAAEELAGVEVVSDQETCDPEDQAMRVAALNALMQMESRKAEPILRKVLARRDECSRELRMSAVFLVADMEIPDSEDLLLDVARNDPDEEIRKNAVFWLSEVGSDRAVAALDSVLNDPNSDQEVRNQAIFAVAESGSPRAPMILLRFIEDKRNPAELRGQAIYWLANAGGEREGEYLRSIYPNLDDPELRQQVFYALAEIGGEQNQLWLIERAMDESESEDVRKNALFWAGEAGVPSAELVRLYDGVADSEFRNYLVWVLAENGDDTSVEKLIEIARNDPDPEVRKQAVFWLAETGDPRAADVLMDILEQ